MVYAYPYAKVERVIDGDTFWASIDLGLRVSVRTKVRVRGCNAPELKSAGGTDARDFLEALLPAGAPITLTSHDWSYDRIVADVMLGTQDIKGALIASGNASKMSS